MQCIVLGSGAMMGFLGLLMILLLPVGAVGRLAGCLACSSMVWSELHRCRTAWATYSRVRVECDGSAALLDRSGQWRPAEVLPGSVLLRHYGWLRLQPHHGGRFAALLRGHCRQSTDWRRLQVIWRHVGAAS